MYRGGASSTRFLTGTGELRVGEFILGAVHVTIATPLNGVRAAMRDYSEICIWMLFVMIVNQRRNRFRACSRMRTRVLQLVRGLAVKRQSDRRRLQRSTFD